MILAFFIFLTLASLTFLLLRERRFLKKNLRDLPQSEELKAYLNRPHTGAHFDDGLQKSRTAVKPSRRLFNDPNPND